MQTDVRRGWALATVAALLLAACAAPQNLSSTSPHPSNSPTEEASPSPTPSPTAPLAITSFAFHSGEVGLVYSPVTLAASGGVPSYQWSLASGSLPPGLSLSPDGVVSGTGTSQGTFGFTVKLSDSVGGAAMGKASVAMYAALTATEPCAVKCSIGAGCTKCGTFGTVSKGLGPYTYKIVGGAVPKGMTLKQLAVTGPFPAGSYSLSVQVTDQLGGQLIIDANWFIYGPLQFSINSDCTNTGFPSSCTATGSYLGFGAFGPPKAVIVGYGQYCVRVACYPKPTAPPPGWKVTVKGGGVITFFADVPCGGPSYTGYVILDLVDTAVCAATSPSNKASLFVNISNGC